VTAITADQRLSAYQSICRDLERFECAPTKGSFRKKEGGWHAADLWVFHHSAIGA
jgi:hypothetical protein